MLGQSSALTLQKWSPVTTEINRDEFLGISFTHHMTILNKTKDINEVLFYIHEAVNHSILSSVILSLTQDLGVLLLHDVAAFPVSIIKHSIRHHEIHCDSSLVAGSAFRLKSAIFQSIEHSREHRNALLRKGECSRSPLDINPSDSSLVSLNIPSFFSIVSSILVFTDQMIPWPAFLLFQQVFKDIQVHS